MPKFAGFNPKQQYVLLQRMGYKGPPREAEMEQALMANPSMAAGLGKMALAAQKRLDQMGYAEGGQVNYEEHQTALDEAQANYSAALAAAQTGGETEADALTQAQANLAVAQEAYNTAAVPSVPEVIGQSISDPASQVTPTEVATQTVDNDELIAAGTGQQASTPQAQVAPVADPEDVTAEAAVAGQAGAPTPIEASTYDPTTVGTEVEGELAGLQAAVADPSENATVRGQLADLMADFEDGTPPWASGAMRQATSIMAQRGMGASSMAGEAIVLAAMQAALPIASADAQTFASFEMASLNNRQQTAIFKTQTRVNAMLSDQAADNASKQFNAASENQTKQFMTGLEAQVSQFNAAQITAINQFNTEQANVISRFNVEQDQNTELFRAREENAMGIFNANLSQQRDQFNATNDLVIAQANTAWRQKVSTLNTQAENIANLEYARAANSLTQRQIDHMMQYERDIMSYTFKSAENAEDRNLSLLLADKELGLANQQMKAERQAAIGYTLTKLFF